MAPAFKIKMDTKEFNRAMVQYAAFTKKTMFEVANRTAKNLAFRTVRFLPKAVHASIARLAFMPWWPKFIAKSISGAGVSWTTGRKNPRTRTYQGSYTRAEARRVSARLLSSRQRSKSFMKSGFLRLAAQFGETKAKPKGGHTRARAFSKLAAPVRPIASFVVEYDSRRRGGRDVRQKEGIGIRALNKAIAFVTEDMRKFVEREMAKEARAVSAR